MTTLVSILLFVTLLLGLGWPLATRWTVSATDQLLTSAVLSLLVIFGFGWIVYVYALPHALFWALPALALAGLVHGRRSLRAAWLDAAFRDLLVGQALVTAWCVGWLALVVTYSGGGWMGDWFGHWQRAQFFLQHGPTDVLFNGFDPLTSRPPLANIVVGVFLALTRNTFASYQLVLTLFSSLAFLPAAALAARWSNAASARRLALLFLVSPLVVQNATFAWTKLPAACFTLAGLYFFLRARDRDLRSAALLCGVSLGAALLTHYSAGPAVVVLAAAWLLGGKTRWGTSSWWRETLVVATAGTAVLTTWFGWTLSVYGARGTFLTNTSVTDQAASRTAQLTTMVLNTRDSIVPYFLRTVDPSLITQSSPWGALRDRWFVLYQVNVLFAFGSLGWLVIAVAAFRRAASTAPTRQNAWIAGLVAFVVLGIAVHAGRDTWGLAHICLQPFVLLGLAFLAVEWEALPGFWRWIAMAGAAVDLVLGIALQFGAQSFLLDQWLAPGRSAAETIGSYSAAAIINLRAKRQGGWTFFGDGFLGFEYAILAFLLLVGVVAALRLRRPAARR